MAPKFASVLHKIVEQGVDLAPSTRERYLRDLDVFIEFAGDDPRRWTPQIAQDFYTFLLGRMETQSANRAFAAVSYAARWYAQTNQIVDFSIIRKATAETNEENERHALAHEDAQRLVKACVADETPIGLRDTAMIVLGLETGMRRMSLRSMTFDTFSPGPSDKIPYPHARVLMKGHGKSRVSVPLSDVCVRALSRWREWMNRSVRGPMFIPLARHLGRDARTTYAPGKNALSEQGIHKIIAGRGADIGLHLHPHLFRHTFVTWRSTAGYMPHEIAAMTGHSIKGIGALGEYLDNRAIGERIRESTPGWLAELIP